MSTVLLPMNRVAEARFSVVGVDDVVEGRVLLGVWLAGVAQARGVVDVGGVAVLPEPPTLPAGTSCHCWLAPPQSQYWAMRSPAVFEPAGTSTAMPLKRLIRRTWPSGDFSRRNCWFAPFRSCHCT